MNDVTVALIGSQGKMGRYLLAPLFERKAAKLIRIDQDASEAERAEAWAADVIVLAVPRSSVEAILDGVRLAPGQLVIDICSCKKDIAAVISQTGATHLSVHPMNGPHTPWSQQKWVMVGEPPAHPLADWFLALLQEKNVLFHAVQSAEEHDLLMSLVLGLPEIITVFLTEFFRRSRSEVQVSTAPEDLLKIACPAFASLLTTHIHTICSTSLWLREDLLTNVHPSFLPRCREVFTALAEEKFFDTADVLLAEQLEDVQHMAAPEGFAAMVRERVTEAFNLMNTLFLGEGIRPQTSLYIQKSCTAEDLLAGKERITVGIHGIHGAFTDEAWQRFAREQLQLSPDCYEVIELVHSSNVLRAVNEGEVDVGIFAFANSGSGGYLSSIEAMGQYHYDLRALFTMPINMCILGHPDRTSVHELRRFFGHPVAISQCRKTLAQRWPDTPVEPATDEMDTALSAKELAAGTIDPQTGVFASKRAAELYGLTILAEGVHHDPSNATAFAVVRRLPSFT